MGNILIGTCGFNYKQWRGVLYPKDLPTTKWLEFYSGKYKTVEINATFYGSFKEETFKKWAQQTPDDFCFAIKGPRFITHILRLKNSKYSLKRFFDSTRGLDGKLGVVLWQFPPSFGKTGENEARFGEFIKLLPKKNSQVFEFRHLTWFEKDTYALLDKNKMGIVISESGRFPREDMTFGGICYIRFHGPTSLYSSSYSTQQLAAWAEKIKKWSKKADVYCFFNNDYGGHAVRNSQELSVIIKNP